MELEGNECVCAEDFEEGRRYARGEGNSFDLVLLDVNLPGKDGWEILAEMRAFGDDTPVIFLTGAQAVEERVKGLRLGADDYIIKPFEAEELLARIEAVVRRRITTDRLEFGRLTLELSRRAVRLGDQPIHLSPGEFDLLRALVEAGGEAISREELLRKVWGMDFDPKTKLVEVQIARLRRKFDRFGPAAIQTVAGPGYALQKDWAGGAPRS